MNTKTCTELRAHTSAGSLAQDTTAAASAACPGLELPTWDGNTCISSLGRPDLGLPARDANNATDVGCPCLELPTWDANALDSGAPAWDTSIGRSTLESLAWDRQRILSLSSLKR